MIGLLGSLHCIGMCGPIALALPVNRDSLSTQIIGVIIYNSGRILTYSILGLLFGLIGRNISLFGAQQYFSIGLGVLIIVIALLPISLERAFDVTPVLTSFLGQVKQKMGLYLQKGSAKSLFLIGFFNGLLPCGLVYFAVVGAIASYDIVEGSLFMAVFGLGTLPMMFAAAISPGFIGVKWRNRVRKALPYFAILIGIMFIVRGMNLGIPYVSPKLTPENIEAAECHTDTLTIPQ